jgi:hypothetical protein
VPYASIAFPAQSSCTNHRRVAAVIVAFQGGLAAQRDIVVMRDIDERSVP